jgi:sulfate adenylyltransferase large subunit
MQDGATQEVAIQEVAVQDVEEHLRRHQQKELLRLVVVGSVDDGKSTLIGRLLHDTNGVYDDQLLAVKRASSQAGMEIDFSLFTDGLKAEREQGITIDVAYRYFSTDKRKFIIADTPGHIQYTRNMATGASTANVALILIDARLGVLTQSRRHAYIASLLGIPHLLVCINKMDLVGFSREVFDRISTEFRAFASQLDFRDVSFVPVSALRGDNIVEKSAQAPWYLGPSVLGFLETVPISADRNLDNFRFPVQYVLRPHLNYRGFAGEIASGRVKKGDAILVLPSRRRTHVASIDTFEGHLESAAAPLSVTLTLTDEVDVSRGDMLVHPDDVPTVDRRFEATLVWMNERPLNLQKSYLLKHTTMLQRVEIEQLLYRTNLDTLKPEPVETLELNDIGAVRIHCHRPLYFDAYRNNRRTGAFVLIDSLNNGTVAAGVISARGASGERPEERADGVGHSMVSPREREERLGQRGAVVLLSGLPGAGKSELAYTVERLLYDQGRLAVVVDPGDALSLEVRSLQNSELGQHPEEVPAGALEFARRAAAAGIIVLLPFAAPRAESRLRWQQAVGEERWLEVAVDTPLEACKQRSTGDFYERYPQPRHDPARSPAASISLAGDARGAGRGGALGEAAGRSVVALLEQRGFLKPR